MAANGRRAFDLNQYYEAGFNTSIQRFKSYGPYIFIGYISRIYAATGSTYEKLLLHLSSVSSACSSGVLRIEWESFRSKKKCIWFVRVLASVVQGGACSVQEKVEFSGGHCLICTELHDQWYPIYLVTNTKSSLQPTLSQMMVHKLPSPKCQRIGFLNIYRV
jgi:hypothetical protein